VTLRRATPVAVVLAAAVLLAGCGDDEDSTETADQTPIEDTGAATAPVTSEGADQTPVSTAAAEPEGTVIEVTVAGGQVKGGGRTSVPLGDAVTIRVTSDVTDHVHLHGYDVLADVAAGGTAELVFTADIPGVFEVELEDAGLALLELEIS
jgi:nitrogenase subunit NifH